MILNIIEEMIVNVFGFNALKSFKAIILKNDSSLIEKTTPREEQIDIINRLTIEVLNEHLFDPSIKLWLLDSKKESPENYTAIYCNKVLPHLIKRGIIHV